MIRKTAIIMFLALAAQYVGRPQGAAPTGLAEVAFAAVTDDTLCLQCPAEEYLTIETWYPSPYNEYEELRLYPLTQSNSQCNNDNRGLMYYSDTDNKVYVCKGTLDGWKELGGAGYWELSGDIIYNNNAGNVGIGKVNPQAKLDVEGKIRMGFQTVDADSQDTVVTKGYLTSYVTAALANSSNSLKVSGTNPSCPSGYVMTSRNWTSACCGPSSGCCPTNSGCTSACNTGGGWKSASDPGFTCQYWMGYGYATCTSSNWSEVLCIR